MSALNWAALAVAVISIVTAFAGSVRWLVKHYLYELKPNSGSSLRDEISELRGRVDTILRILER
jgi:DNA-binding MarR family transcriptional regulator